MTIFFGAVSAFFLNIGFIPQLILIYKAQEVIGLSYAFLAMDSGGAVFSIMSLGFKEGSIDLVALLGYGRPSSSISRCLVLICFGASTAVLLFFEIAILIAAAILNPRARRRRLRESDSAVEGGAGDTASSTPIETEEQGKETSTQVV